MQIQLGENQDQNWFTMYFENGPAGILLRMGPDETENPGRTRMWVKNQIFLIEIHVPSLKITKLNQTIKKPVYIFV